MNDYIYEFKDLPSTDTPYNAKTFTAMQYKLLDSIYPIGSIMIKDESIDYSNFLGFTWEKVFSGVTLVGLDADQEEFNEIGKTGGEKTHTLTISEMPSHNHDVIYNKSATSGFVSFPSATNAFGEQKLASELGFNALRTAGGSKPHNNLPSYQVVVFWKRIA